MLASLNLSRRDAWTRVAEYVVMWLIFWLLLGLLGRIGVRFADPALSNVPLPPVLQPGDPQPVPVALPSLALRGQVERSVVVTGSAAVDEPEPRPVEELPAAAPPPRPAADVSSEFSTTAPPGFADLLGVQSTQADVYFRDQLVVSTFIEFDLEHVWFLAPEEVVEAIPTLIDPEKILVALTGELDSNSHLLCNSRVRENCGVLEPEVAGIIFNEARFRIDLFVHDDELEIQMLVGDRYLPAPTADWATLHDVSLSASGQYGQNQYNLAAESFVSKGGGRVRVRYGMTNNGAALHEASWQWDKRDREFEAGVFRSARGSSLFINDLRLLGVRFGSSTKTRRDLDNALATPILIFLDRRSRVDILRDDQILDSRFYDAGNHQLDTTRLPDGAYDITVRTVDAAGAENDEQHFFVRNSLLPPLGEQQFYIEAGAFTEDYGSSLPEPIGGGWLRGGLSRRLTSNFALEGEALLSDEVSLLQGGAYFLGRNWQVHSGLLASDRGDHGYSLRGQYQRKRVSLSVNLQHLNSRTPQGNQARINPLLGQQPGDQPDRS